MSRISRIDSWEALDSRGRPTVAARVTLNDGSHGMAIAPSGASTGSHEARERRDGGARYAGAGVRAAVANVVDIIAPALIGGEGDDPRAIDARLCELDDSVGFETLGANAVLAVSVAVWQAAAASAKTSLARYLQPTGSLLLPMPMVNIVSGGAHAGGLIDLQDILVIPHGAEDFASALEWSAAVRAATRDVALRQGHATAVLVADEGGLGLALADNRSAIDLVVRGIEQAGLVPGVDASVALDVAATEFAHNGVYRLSREGLHLDAASLLDEMRGWVEDFPIVSLEDPLAEDDWAGWREATRALGEELQLIGDDLFVTDRERVLRGIRERSANAVLIKVNQRGTVSEAFDALKAARDAGWATVVSARSGDTEQSWLADLAVGWSAGQIKVGSTHRSERTAKWNRLLELEAIEDTSFAGPWRSSPSNSGPFDVPGGASRAR